MTTTQQIKTIIEVYKKHPIILKRKDIFENKTITNSFQFQSVTEFHIATLLKQQIDNEKATGIDKISSKLVKLSANVVYTPYGTINASLSSGIFPNTVKIATVSLIHKGIDNKNSIS